MRAVLRRALICLISAQTALVLTLTGSARTGLGAEHCMDLHFLCRTDVLPGICWVRYQAFKADIVEEDEEPIKINSHQDYRPVETTACDISEYRPGPWGIRVQSRWRWRSRCDRPLGRFQLWKEENESSHFEQNLPGWLRKPFETFPLLIVSHAAQVIFFKIIIIIIEGRGSLP